MGYIGAHGVAALQRYKYSGVDNSYLAKYVLQPFWSRFVNFFPLWMPYIRLVWIQLHLDGFILHMACFYFYIRFRSTTKMQLCQTFDAVDGKQARRTNSSSPLGELFDHGCDALACAFEAMAFGSTAMCGRDTFWFWVISAVPFFGATWEHYFTNTLILPVVNGPTEGLMLIYVGHFFTAIVGAEWWAQNFGNSMPFLSWVPFINAIPTNRAVLYLMIAFGVIPTVYFNVSNVYKVVQSRNGSILRALAMLYPFVVLLVGVLAWDYLSPAEIIRKYPHFVVLGTGLAFGFLVGRMILAHLCDEPKGLKTNMCMSLLYLPFAVANALTAKLNDGDPLVDEFWVLLGYCIFTAGLYLHFATSVIHEITTALGLPGKKLESFLMLTFGWQVGSNAAKPGTWHVNFGLVSVTDLYLDTVSASRGVGPESLAFDCGGEGPYVSVSDGRSLKWRGSKLGWTQFATTTPYWRLRRLCDGSTSPRLEPWCGRPLGIEFSPVTCDLYIADAYFGLPKTEAGGYLKYDPHSNEVTIIYRGLAFPNGVALIKDKTFLLVAESIPMRVLRFWLHDHRAMCPPQPFAQLQKFPDNIEADSKGEFWVA
ncbi:Choline/ethanolaminephosphotransferase 1 [Citrus sinensis]|nr:Choline/ethanolaminephosphotransferase 1 [Citrus sinensis]